MKTNKQVCNNFAKNLNSWGLNMHTYDGRLWSYSTVICEKLNSKTYLINGTGYSITTSQHTREALAALSGKKFIYVYNIPLGADNLKYYYDNKKRLESEKEKKEYIDTISTNLWYYFASDLKFMEIEDPRFSSTIEKFKTIWANSDDFEISDKALKDCAMEIYKIKFE